MGKTKEEFTKIVVAHGDGIGPEIMESVLSILRYAEARITIESIDIGYSLYKRNYIHGISEDAFNVINNHKILLKAPIITPQMGGYRSVNVTLRKAMGLYANIRPAVSFYPYIDCKNTNDLDVVVIRENEEDLYSGVEYRPTHNVCEALRLFSRTGCQKIIRYAFEYARLNGRKKVSCFTKDNIMKMTDGLFHSVFNEIKEDYPDIETDHHIIDIGTARLATQPENFDVIVTSNLFGDIISDLIAEVVGSVGLVGSANIGTDFAMFEAIHGSAPDIAGKGIANPSGLINAAIMMLVHLKQFDVAANIENAWKKTIEDGMHTKDVFSENTSSKCVTTSEFTKEVISRLGQEPVKLKKSIYSKISNKDDIKNHDAYSYVPDLDEDKNLIGIDIYLDISALSASEIHKKVKNINSGVLKLYNISTMGIAVWPHNARANIYSDHWCCRFLHANEGHDIDHATIINLLREFAKNNISFTSVRNLYSYDKKQGYTSFDLL